MTKIILKTILLLVISISIVFMMINIPIKYLHDLAIVENKFDLLSKKKLNRKIVFVGGSALSVGIDSRAISKALNYDVVNLGIYAGYGINPWLEKSKQYLKPGDIVIIIPEFAILLNNKSFWPTDKDTFKWFLAADTMLALKQMYSRNNNYKLLFRDISELFKDRISTISYVVKNKSYSQIVGRGRFDSSGFNEFGDVVVEVFKKKDPSKFEDYRKVYPRKPITDDKIEGLNKYNEYYKKHNIKAYFMFSCYPEEEYVLNKDQFSQITKQLRRSISMEVLGDSSTFIFPVVYFIDTANHLTPSGRDLRTKIMIDMLTAELN